MKSRQLRGPKSGGSIARRPPERQTAQGVAGSEPPRRKRGGAARAPAAPAPDRRGVQPKSGKPAAATTGADEVAVVGVRVVEVAADRDGQRLDNYLLGLLKGVPKSHVYRLLRTGQVRVDGRRAKADHRLATGERLRIPPVRVPDLEELPRAPARVLSALASRIVHEDRRFIALDKPSGLASHGGSGISLGAIEQLRQMRPRESLELVHRLDRDTSGVLLFAKRRSALLAAQAAIREGRARKRYLALLVGRMPQSVVRVDAPLEKSVLRGGERMVEVSASGKASRTEFRRVESFAGFTAVEVLIDTGRTHQIRVHARHIGLPVAGDPKYGDAAANQTLRDLGLRRLFLHSAELGLDLGAEGDYTFNAPLPGDLAAVLAALGSGRDPASC